MNKFIRKRLVMYLTLKQHLKVLAMVFFIQQVGNLYKLEQKMLEEIKVNQYFQKIEKECHKVSRMAFYFLASFKDYG